MPKHTLMGRGLIHQTQKMNIDEGLDKSSPYNKRDQLLWLY
ncbi:MAG: hypothetical protein QG657_4451 [Acidobacteriota bacterium]|nr:hypothetical protein [Acidobacteriota bacterium]